MPATRAVNAFFSWLSVALAMIWISVATGHAQDGQHPASDAAQEEPIVLFDGTDLKHWRGYGDEEIGKGWKIVDDTLHFDGTGGGDIITRDKYSNFELTLQWRISQGGNSGIMYLVSTGDAASYMSGPEYQILDDTGHSDGKNKLTAAGALYGLYPQPDDIQAKPAGEWNSTKIVIKDNVVEHWLNGKKIVAAKIGGDEWNEKVADSKFRDWKKFGKNREGHICLQDHENPVWFRNIKIRKLAGDKESSSQY